MVVTNNKEPEIKSEKINIPKVGKIVLSNPMKQWLKIKPL